MNSFCCILLAVLSIWDYADRHDRHDFLRNQFLSANRSGDNARILSISKSGVDLLPDDPVWRYNYACALARNNKGEQALAELKTAIDLGYRDVGSIVTDRDLKGVCDSDEFEAVIDYARSKEKTPLAAGPMVFAPCKVKVGKTAVLNEKNVTWNFDSGCFLAGVDLQGLTVSTNSMDAPPGNQGDLYFNRDGNHSPLALKDFPGLTPVRLGKSGIDRKLDRAIPNFMFSPKFPVFGNSSTAWTQGPEWRSIPRMMMTKQCRKMGLYSRLYLSNQFWVFPAVNDYAPNNPTNSDVFASMSPFWLTTAGASWSDQYYLRSALKVSRWLPRDTKAELIRRGMLTPVIMSLMRRALKDVDTPEAYLSPAAHPIAWPPNGLDQDRLKKLSQALRPEQIPPLVAVNVAISKIPERPALPEVTYTSPFTTAIVLRSPSEPVRQVRMKAAGAKEYAFAIVHDNLGAATLTNKNDSAMLEIDSRRMGVNHRVDIAVFGRNEGTDWGAPSYVSFAVVDPDAPYSDPVLTPKRRQTPAAKAPEAAAKAEDSAGDFQ